MDSQSRRFFAVLFVLIATHGICNGLCGQDQPEPLLGECPDAGRSVSLLRWQYPALALVLAHATPPYIRRMPRTLPTLFRREAFLRATHLRVSLGYAQPNRALLAASFSPRSD